MEKYIFVLLLVMLISFSFGAEEQYRVYCWENFESGKFPSTLRRIHDSNDQNVIVVSYENLKKDPKYSKILDGIARTECGNFGLFFSIPKSEVEKKTDGVFLSIVSDIILDRHSLKNIGKAIIQADVFIPEDTRQTGGTSIPGIAVLGVGGANPHDFTKWALYRIGISPRYGVFFSFLDAVKSPVPIIFKEDKFDTLKLQVAGWHRLQLVFQGSDIIGGYVDGIKTSYSPITEGSVSSLRMGMMISSSSQADKFCVIDNLSIQVAGENLPLPTSPWRIADGSRPIQSQMMMNYQKPDFIESKLQWFLTPEDAVQFNKDKGLEYLILFYSPLARMHKPLESMINTDISFQNFLKQFVLTRLDVNQLKGGRVAEFYNIFKVPCFLLLDKNGNKKDVLIYKEGMQCSEIADKIQAMKTGIK